MLSQRQFFSSLLGIVLLSSPGIAQEKPWWNPFARDDADETTEVRQSSFFDQAETERSSSSTLQFPMLSSITESASRQAKSGKMMMVQMTRSTKKFFTNTIDFINPFDSPAPKRSTDSFLSQGYQPQNIVDEPKSGGFFGWFKQEEPVSEPATVNDWLRQPNPLLSSGRQ
ncbi:MAG: hypothetical protein KDB22_23895 [Planctomycetales bacterium]|nr:hypothetical protein [Planctomycetales bacterium]